jgi:hypothetical protein
MRAQFKDPIPHEVAQYIETLEAALGQAIHNIVFEAGTESTPKLPPLAPKEMRRGEQEYVHSNPNGTVSVRMHKRHRLTLVVSRDELDAALIEQLERLQHQNRMLRRKVTDLSLTLKAEGNR